MEMSWQFVGACVDGERFEIGGVNVWDCKWNRIPSLVASVRDPHHNQSHEFNVYDSFWGSARSGSRPVSSPTASGVSMRPCRT